MADGKLIQTIILVTGDGKRTVYTGPHQLDEGDTIKDIKVIFPSKPLPNGCSWDSLQETS